MSFSLILRQKWVDNGFALQKQGVTLNMGSHFYKKHGLKINQRWASSLSLAPINTFFYLILEIKNKIQ